MITEVHNNSQIRLIKVHKRDNVAVCLNPAKAGETVQVEGDSIRLNQDIPANHKIALRQMRPGESVIKYGCPIGVVHRDISQGDHVHEHNIKTQLSGIETYTYEPELDPKPAELGPSDITFNGYLRDDGRVGTRNEIWILPTVGCVAQTARRLADLANQKYADMCDGIVAFTHPFGCSQMGDDLEQTRALITALANHPNAGGVLVLGLGCETNQGKGIVDHIPDHRRERVRFFNAQEARDEFDSGLSHLEALISIASKDQRTTRPLADLVLGTKCGGSDGLSGLTANALVGQVSDLLCNAGGKVLLTEVPEMFGAEQELMNRAKTPEVFDQIVELINGFKHYYMDHNLPVYENPSPGNKAGGITTLEEKSLGAIQKGGRAIVTDVIGYTDPVEKSGLTLLEAPGNDAVSSTALAASGATVILFTTGRGTPLGFPAPTIKVSSNSDLASRKPSWIDFDAGALVQGGTRDATTKALLEFISQVASLPGSTRAEINQQREIAIWKKGVTL